MSTAAAVSQAALVGDGAFLGLAAAYFAVRSIIKFTTTSAALGKIRGAPSVHVADLRSIASLSDREHIVVVRGKVESKSSVGGFWDIFFPDTIVSQKSDVEGVISHRTQTCMYNQSRGWTSHLGSLFSTSWKQQRSSSSISMVPFVLEGGSIHESDYIIVNMDGSIHPLPLVTVFQELELVHASPFALLALSGQEYPVGLLNEEKMLPLEKEITAVGYVSFKDEIAEIRSCKDLPYFLSDMTKNEMLEELNSKAKVLLWSGIVFGSFAIGLLGYAAMRNWGRCKKWRQHCKKWRQHWKEWSQQNCDEATEEEEELDDGDARQVIPDGQLIRFLLTV